jgi:hypothetical protein
MKHGTTLFMAAVGMGSEHGNAASGAPEYRMSSILLEEIKVRRTERTYIIDKGNPATYKHLHDLYQLHTNATLHISFVVKRLTF